MLDTREFHPLTDFLRNHKTHMARLKQTKTPEVFTVNGRAEVVMLDVDSYQDMLEHVQHLETLTAIREGIASADRGELKSAEQVLNEIRTKYGLHR